MTQEIMGSKPHRKSYRVSFERKWRSGGRDKKVGYKSILLIKKYPRVFEIFTALFWFCVGN